MKETEEMETELKGLEAMDPIGMPTSELLVTGVSMAQQVAQLVQGMLDDGLPSEDQQSDEEKYLVSICNRYSVVANRFLEEIDKRVPIPHTEPIVGPATGRPL